MSPFGGKIVKKILLYLYCKGEKHLCYILILFLLFLFCYNDFSHRIGTADIHK